jgi:hypothetical protein
MGIDGCTDNMDMDDVGKSFGVDSPGKSFGVWDGVEDDEEPTRGGFLNFFHEMVMNRFDACVQRDNNTAPFIRPFRI